MVWISDRPEPNLCPDCQMEEAHCVCVSDDADRCHGCGELACVCHIIFCPFCGQDLALYCQCDFGDVTESPEMRKGEA